MNEIEFKRKKEDITGKGELCLAGKCKEDAVTRYFVGEVGIQGATPIELCDGHDYEQCALDVYMELLEEEL